MQQKLHTIALLHLGRKNTTTAYNIVGNLVWSAQVQGATAVQKVDLGELESGNYLLRVSNEGNKVTRRVTLLD